MPRVFVAPERLGGATATVDGDAHRHLTKVLRLRPGDGLVVFDGQGTEIEATLLSDDGRRAELRLGARRAVAPAPVAITLLQGVPRGERMELVIQKTTELGVARIVPVLTARAVARPPANRLRRWETIAREAARQCGRADVPAIAAPAPLAQALALEADARVVLWEEPGGVPLRRALVGPERAVALLVGPEGGLTPEEVADARAAGFLPASLGPRVLRSETAGIVAVALAQAAAGGLD